MLLLSLAWRNLWRNTRRTVITLSALVLGTAGIIGITSYRESTFHELVRTITVQLVGDIQIHRKGYQATPDIENVVTNPIAVEARVENALPGAHTERRVIGAGLAGAGESSAGVMIMGVEAGTGMGALDIVKGRALTPDADAHVDGAHVDGAQQPPRVTKHEAVIGAELADQLGVDVGGEIVLVGQAADGSVANDRYRVVGTADPGTSEMSSTAVFLGIADAQDFFGLGDGVHQLVVHLPAASESEAAPVAALRTALDLRTLEAMSWNELLPELTGTIKAKRQGQYSMDFIIFLIVALGVLNAMTMSTFERTRELGVMLALGTRPRRIVSMIVLEALLQGVIGLVVGAALAEGVMVAIGDVHLAGLSRGDMLGVRLPAVVHLAFDMPALGAAAVTIFFTMLAGGLLPAIRAARLPAVDAMRAD